MDPASTAQLEMCVKHIGQPLKCCKTSEMTWADLMPTQTSYRNEMLGKPFVGVDPPGSVEVHERVYGIPLYLELDSGLRVNFGFFS